MHKLSKLNSCCKQTISLPLHTEPVQSANCNGYCVGSHSLVALSSAGSQGVFEFSVLRWRWVLRLSDWAFGLSYVGLRCWSCSEHDWRPTCCTRGILLLFVRSAILGVRRNLEHGKCTYRTLQVRRLCKPSGSCGPCCSKARSSANRQLSFCCKNCGAK